MPRILVPVFLLLALAHPCFAQGWQQLPFEAAQARQRRASREIVVARLGEGVRGLIEAHDEAVAALVACRPSVAHQLARFHDEGNLARLPRPGLFLSLVGAPGHGDEVALFGIANVDALTVPAVFDRFAASPLEYSLGLRPLTGPGSGSRQLPARPAGQGGEAESPWWSSRYALVAGLAGVGVIALLLKSRGGRGKPQ